MDEETEAHRGQSQPARKWQSPITSTAPGCCAACATSSHNASGIMKAFPQMSRPAGEAESVLPSLSGTGQHEPPALACHQHLLSHMRGSLGASVPHVLRRQQEKGVHAGRPGPGLRAWQRLPLSEGQGLPLLLLHPEPQWKAEGLGGARNGRKWGTPHKRFP